MNFDEWQLDDFGTIAFEQCGELSSLVACACDDDLLTHEWSTFEPLGLGAFGDNFANDNHGGGENAGRFNVTDD